MCCGLCNVMSLSLRCETLEVGKRMILEAVFLVGVEWVNLLLLETVNMVKKHEEKWGIMGCILFQWHLQFADNRKYLLGSFVEITDIDQSGVVQPESTPE